MHHGDVLSGVSELIHSMPLPEWRFGSPFPQFLQFLGFLCRCKVKNVLAPIFDDTFSKCMIYQNSLATLTRRNIPIIRAVSAINPEMADTGSIAHKFVDIDGIGRGVERFSVFRYIEGETEPECDKAALGKSRRLMSSCINDQASSIR